MTLAQLGLGVFVLGVTFETAWKIEAAEVLAQGGGLALGAYHMALDRVAEAEGPNSDAERGTIRVTKGGAPVCAGQPERRTYAADGQPPSEVAICAKGLDDIYLVLGEGRTRADGTPGWLVRAYWNPWARFIFLGPIIMALGGLISLSDRRLRFAVGRKAVKPVSPPVALEPAE